MYHCINGSIKIRFGDGEKVHDKKDCDARLLLVSSSLQYICRGNGNRVLDFMEDDVIVGGRVIQGVGMEMITVITSLNEVVGKYVKRNIKKKAVTKIGKEKSEINVLIEDGGFEQVVNSIT